MHPSLAHKLDGMPGVLRVWEDEIRPLATTHSLDFLELFDADKGLRGPEGLTGEDVIIAFIDSGIAPEHPALSDTREADRPRLCQTSWAENTLLGKWLCRRYDKLVMPGALTPTEVITAWEAGAHIVKIFPADLGGPQYLKAIRGPLPQVRLMPTGGVDLDTADSFLRAGACALGVGGSLVSRKAVATRDLQQIETLASKFVAVVRRFRENP